MNTNPNKRNSKFQTKYFLAGSCHTADAAYALLLSQKEERVNAIEGSKAAGLRQEVKRLRAEKVIATLGGSTVEEDRWAVMEAEADLQEIASTLDTQAKNLAGALDELAGIEEVLAEIQPMRRFSHLSDMDAHEAAQQEEWRLELLHRAENVFLTGGALPPAELATMRMHPEFLTGINPQLDAMRLALITREGSLELLAPKGLQGQLAIESQTS